MRSDLLARVLVRLYPRGWRSRYGDEFLALIEDAGLSWRAAANIVTTALIERTRALLSIAFEMDDTTGDGLSAADIAADLGAFMTVATAIVWALVWLGAPAPPWSWWFSLPYFRSTYWAPTSPAASASERLVVSVGWLLAAIGIAAVGCLAGIALAGAGAPAISGGLALLTFVVLAIAAAARALQCGIWLAHRSGWPGVTRRELFGWNAALLLVVIVMSASEPDDLEAFWSIVVMHWLAIRPMLGSTAAGRALLR